MSKPSLPLYPAYKPTAIPWLQQVPEHWEVLPGLSHLRFKQVKNTGMVEKQVLSLSYGRIIIKPQEKLTGLVPESFETYQIVDPGDIIIRATDLQNDRTSLRVGEVKDRGIITSAYLCLNVHSGMVPAYGYYLIHAYDLMKWLYGYGSGLRQNLDWVDFKRMPLVVPPPAEQHLIVRYLHALDAKVKRYIRAKRSLIARLQEQKQAIIQRAVTRGLDPKVKLKPSSVEWLGEVPVHWEVRSNRSMLRIRKVQVGERSKDYVLLSLTLRGVIARDMENPEGKFPAEFNTYQEVRPGDLVFCLFDVDETPRTVGLSPLHGMITGAYTVFECIDPRIAKFLYYFYLAVDHQKSLKPFYTGLRKVVQKSTFLGIKIAIPPKSEIEPVLDYLEREVGAVDAGIARVEQEIKLMTEYHTRLIADVVTGAVDVRAVAQALPEDQMIGRSDDQMMEEEPLSMAAEGESEYGEEPEL